MTTIKPELLDELLSGAASPDDLMGDEGLFRQLKKALGTQGKYLSPILLDLGWSRKRKWTGLKQYPRYWMPPPSAEGSCA
jgi:hypothetical protein